MSMSEFLIKTAKQMRMCCAHFNTKPESLISHIYISNEDGKSFNNICYDKPS